MNSWMERSSPNLVPIKSSLSIILGDAQVWSDTVCASAEFMAGSWNGAEDADRLDVFAQRLAARKDVAQECDKRKKKSRQVFTYSHPPSAGVVPDLTGKDIEVYESIGQDTGLFCGMEPHLHEESAPDRPCQLTEPVPGGAASQVLGSDRTIRQAACDLSAEISYPTFTLPQEVRSAGELKTCFPYPAVPSLFYTVSDSSLPVLKRSSMVFSRLSSQKTPLHFSYAGLEEELVAPSRTLIPLYGIRPSCFWLDASKLKTVSCDLAIGRSILFNPHCKDILIRCKNMDDALAKKIAQTIQTVNSKAQRRKFMNYAKFSSSFKLSEVFYEDINSQCLSHVPSLRPSFRLPGLIHKVNPDYDENQSISEAMTLMSLSSVTSMSRITRMCKLGSSANTLTTGPAFKRDWTKSNVSSCKKDSEPTKHTEVPFSASSAVSLADFITTARKQQLSRLQGSVRSAFEGGQKETDIWSSSASTGCREVRATPKRLVDVASPSCIFRASVMDRKTLPVWKLIPDKPRLNYRTELVNDFIFKAHNYMHLRDRPNSHRCFFQQQPTYRVVDEGVQFPDVALGRDRSPNVKEPRSESYVPAKNTDQSALPVVEDKIDPESSPVMSPELNSSSVNGVDPENQDLPHSTNLTVVVACDQPLYSTSEFPAVFSDPVGPSAVAVPKTGTEESSSVNLPASTSSNKCQFSTSEYHTVSTAASFQPRNRKLAGSKLQPIAEDPKRCKVRNRRLPESSQFCHSYRALCDKRKIKIKYENGRFTVLKQMRRSKRRTIWSFITGKVTDLVKSVVHGKSHVHRASGR